VENVRRELVSAGPGEWPEYNLLLIMTDAAGWKDGLGDHSALSAYIDKVVNKFNIDSQGRMPDTLMIEGEFER
jgi:hypothetical protein